MKVATRLYLTFFLFVGLLVAVAGLNYFMSITLSHQVEASVSPSLNATALLAIDRDVARLSYLVHVDEEADPLYAHIIARLKGLENGPLSEPQRSVLQHMHWVLTDNYWAKHTQLVPLDAERRRLGERALPEAGERLRARMSELVGRAAESGSAEATRMASRAEETLLLTRLATLHYYTEPKNANQHREARKLLVQLEVAFNDFARHPPNAKSAELANGLMRELPTYRELVRQLEEATDRKLTLEEQMDNAVAEISQLARQLSDSADRRLGELEQTVQSESVDTRVVSLALTLIAAVFAAVAAHFIGRRISRPLTAISQTIHRITKGEHDIPIPAVDSKDEIGDLARAATDIRELVSWSEAQRWTQSSLAELARTIQEAKNSQDLASAVVMTLAPKLNSGYMALYLFNCQGRIELAAGFGVACDIRPHPGFALGEGLVGQCAAQQKSIYIDEVPTDYLRIHSGLGERSPLYLALMPIIHRSVLHGVVEVATFKPLTLPQKALLEEAMPLLALHFENLFRHQRTQELLEESQRQAEELQASEEELKTQSEELQVVNERLSEQKRELEAANDAAAKTAEELAQASRHKSEFLASMSHELRTPLNSLLILSKDLAHNSDGNLNTEQIEAARVINDAGTHLLGLINDILDLSKVEAGKLSVKWTEVDLHALVQTVGKRFAPAATDKGLDFSVQFAESAPRNGWTDGARLEQILHNLLSNAVKYTAAGSVSLTMEACETKSAGESWVSFAVTDTGAGVAPKDFERMFDAFERLDEQQGGGTGLGLAISRRLARLLGGDIAIRSDINQGSTFTLRLPMHAPKNQEVPTSLPSDLSGRRNIVVIEDDPHFAALLCRRAEEKGFFCICATRGEAGIEAIKRARPAGVILDLGLPDMDGWQVIDFLKMDPQLADIPVHIISGREPPNDTHGAASFAMKPVSVEKIAQILERIAATEGEGKKRVLLVDPDPYSRRATADLLSERGLEIVEAERGEHALERLDGDRFCCVVSELHLPDTDVVELLQQAKGRVPALPAVIVFTEAEPSADQSLRLREFTDTVVLKGARASQRLLDEVSLFLHSVGRTANTADERAMLHHEESFVDKTVLLVDDDMRNTFAMSKVLRGRGLKVLLAQNGRKALAALGQAKRVDAVLMDVMMPEMDGIEATKAIRSLPQWRDLPIIALTAKAMRGDRERCLEAGANDYLAKPVDIDELLSRLRSWLAR